MNNLLAELLPTFISSLAGGALAAGVAWVAMRVTLAKVEQRLADHIGEDHRRFAVIERAIGIDGSTPAFVRREEADVHVSIANARWEQIQGALTELRNGQKDIMELVAQVRNYRS
jgi:hypothetical protein